MSIKIHNGFILPKVDLKKLFTIVADLKSEVQKKQLAMYNEMFLEKALEFYIHAALDNEVVIAFEEASSTRKELASVKYLVQKYLEANQKKLISNEKMDHFYFHAHFFFNDGKVYSLNRDRGQGSFDSLFAKVTGAKEFNYYNNVDRPKNVSAAAWKKRSKIWEELFKNAAWDADEATTLKVEAPFKVSYHRFEDKNKKISDTLFSKVVNEVAKHLVARDKEPDLNSTTQDIVRYFMSEEYANLVKVKAEEITKLVAKPSVEDVLKKELHISKEYTTKEHCISLSLNTF